TTFPDALLATVPALEFRPNAGWPTLPHARARSQSLLLAHGARANLFSRLTAVCSLRHECRLLGFLAVRCAHARGSVPGIVDGLVLPNDGDPRLAAYQDCCGLEPSLGRGPSQRRAGAHPFDTAVGEPTPGRACPGRATALRGYHDGGPTHPFHFAVGGSNDDWIGREAQRQCVGTLADHLAGVLEQEQRIGLAYSLHRFGAGRSARPFPRALDYARLGCGVD